MTKKTEIKIGSHILEISNPDKVLFPVDGITKGDLIDYYTKRAEVMIPHMKGRPLNMDRFPDGIDKKDFFQQSIPVGYPEWDELYDGKLNSLSYSMSNISRLLSERPDPWRDIYRHSQSLKEAWLELRGMSK